MVSTVKEVSGRVISAGKDGVSVLVAAIIIIMMLIMK